MQQPMPMPPVRPGMPRPPGPPPGMMPPLPHGAVLSAPPTFISKQIKQIKRQRYLDRAGGEGEMNFVSR